MTTVHILTPGFVAGNGEGFLFPIIYHTKALREAGIRYRIYESVEPALTDCDVLIVDSKFYVSAWPGGSAPILEEVDHLRRQAGGLIWFDTSDSTGTLQTAVFPLVDRYYKNLVLKDRSLYKKAMYGMRIFTDFYNRAFGVVDEQPKFSEPVNDSDLAKLNVGWNPGLADYSVWAPMRSKLFRQGFRRQDQRSSSPNFSPTRVCRVLICSAWSARHTSVTRGVWITIRSSQPIVAIT
mgnify:CR=1 FL=1